MALFHAEVVHQGDDVIGEGIEGEGFGIEGHGVAVPGEVRGDEAETGEIVEARGRLGFSGSKAV